MSTNIRHEDSYREGYCDGYRAAMDACKEILDRAAALELSRPFVLSTNVELIEAAQRQGEA